MITLYYIIRFSAIVCIFDMAEWVTGGFEAKMYKITSILNHDIITN